MPAVRAYPSGHLVPSLLGLVYTPIVETIVFMNLFCVFRLFPLLFLGTFSTLHLIDPRYGFWRGVNYGLIVCRHMTSIRDLLNLGECVIRSLSNVYQNHLLIYERYDFHDDIHCEYYMNLQCTKTVFEM